MRLNPASTKASSRRNAVASSAVQPNTLPPKASGPTAIPEPPSVRIFMFHLLRQRGRRPCAAFPQFRPTPVVSVSAGQPGGGSVEGRRAAGTEGHEKIHIAFGPVHASG